LLLLDLVGLNHKVWKKITNELSVDGFNITPVSIKVCVAKIRLECLGKVKLYTPLADDDNQNK